MRFDPALARLFLDHTSTVQHRCPTGGLSSIETRVYEEIRLLLRLNVLARCGRLKEVSSSTWEFDMTARHYLRTHDLALAGHISVQESSSTIADGWVRIS